MASFNSGSVKARCSYNTILFNISGNFGVGGSRGSEIKVAQDITDSWTALDKGGHGGVIGTIFIKNVGDTTVRVRFQSSGTQSIIVPAGKFVIIHHDTYLTIELKVDSGSSTVVYHMIGSSL